METPTEQAAVAAGGAEDGTRPEDGRRAATLDFLLRRMRRRTDFPTTAANITELRAKTRELDRAQVSEVANVILRDYALSTKVLKLVNSSFYGQYGGRISTISRAVVLLGIRQVQAAALSLLMFEHMADHAQAQALRDAAGRSILSGMLSRGLADEAELGEPEEVFVCSMLRRLGEYLAIYYLPDEYAAIRARVQTGGESEATACRQVLGLDYAELGIGVAREWQLPDEILLCMRPLPDGRLSEPRGQHERLHRLAGFGDELAGVVLMPPSPDRDRVLAELDERYRASLPLPKGGLVPLIRRSVEDSRVYAGIVGQGVAGSRTLQLAEAWTEQPREAAGAPPRTGAASGEEAPASAEEERREALLRGIQDVSNALLEGCALNDVLLMVLETLYRGMALTRVLFCVRDRRTGRVAARFGLGADIDRLLARFRFDPREGRDLFSRAVGTQRDVLYPGDRHRPADLPEWYRVMLSPRSFALLPVVVSGVCIGLIYCDQQTDPQPLGPSHLNYLNTLRNQAALAIKQQR